MIAARQIFLGRGAGGGGWVNPYVMDGLVAMWDGEWNAGGGKRCDSAMVWTDCINGIVATPNNFKQSADYSFGWGNGCSVRHCNLGISDSRIKDAMNLSECTYEFSLTRRDGTNRFYFLGTGRGKGSYQNSANQFYVSKGANGVTTILPWSNRILVDTTVSLACVFSNGTRTVYWNGSKIGDYSATESTSSAITYLFGDGYDYADFTTCADIYATRVYSRALTAAEIAANYAIDKQRFNLP